MALAGMDLPRDGVDALVTEREGARRDIIVHDVLRGYKMKGGKEAATYCRGPGAGEGANLTIGNARCRLFQGALGKICPPLFFPPLFFPPFRSAGKVPSSFSLFSEVLELSC